MSKILDETRLERVSSMSESYDRLDELVDDLTVLLDRFEASRTEIARLTEYMESGAWKADFEADEAGRIPEGVNRSVLSEDGLYDLLAEIDLLHARCFQDEES